jgi:hypothetical protein
MASSSHSMPFGAPHAASLSLDPYRDQEGFLPLVPCHKCSTVFIGRVSQKPGSKGKRFYKCPLFEHVSCGWFVIRFWEDAFFGDFHLCFCRPTMLVEHTTLKSTMSSTWSPEVFFLALAIRVELGVAWRWRWWRMARTWWRPTKVLMPARPAGKFSDSSQRFGGATEICSW